MSIVQKSVRTCVFPAIIRSMTPEDPLQENKLYVFTMKDSKLKWWAIIPRHVANTKPI